MKTKSLALVLALLLLSNAQGNEQPCSPASLAPGLAGICVYDLGKKPLFVSVRVVLDGEVQGKLAKQQPWLWVNAKPGAHVVGIDLGKSAQARRKIQAAAGDIKYLRYQQVREHVTGFFDVSTAVQSDLREVSASDAASELEQLAASVSKKQRR